MLCLVQKVTAFAGGKHLRSYIQSTVDPKIFENSPDNHIFPLPMSEAKVVAKLTTVHESITVFQPIPLHSGQFKHISIIYSKQHGHFPQMLSYFCNNSEVFW